MLSPQPFLDSNAPFVQTVKGPIAPEQLGAMLMHEHLMTDWPWATGSKPIRLETVAAIYRVLQCLKRAHEAGVRGLLDCGMEQFGPSPLALLCIALQTPVHIVCSTGLFAQDLLPLPGWAHLPYGEQDIARHFIAAATNGQDGSGVKPGVVKVASSADGITTLEKKAFRAAASAQHATGLAITTHSWLTLWVEEQVELLAEAGADLDRVIIGHIGWGTTVKDSAMHRRLAKRGVMLGVDCVGSPARSVEENADIILDLLDAGYASQIVLSHDQAAYTRGLVELFKSEKGWLAGDFTMVSKQLLPLLRKRGVNEDTLDRMMVKNPQRVLSVDPRRYPGARSTLLSSSNVDPLAPYDYGMATDAPSPFQSKSPSRDKKEYA
jgi:phosphotriesterase-related protein